MGVKNGKRWLVVLLLEPLELSCKTIFVPGCLPFPCFTHTAPQKFSIFQLCLKQRNKSFFKNDRNACFQFSFSFSNLFLFFIDDCLAVRVPYESFSFDGLRFSVRHFLTPVIYCLTTFFRACGKRRVILNQSVPLSARVSVPSNPFFMGVANVINTPIENFFQLLYI